MTMIDPEDDTPRTATSEQASEPMLVVEEQETTRRKRAPVKLTETHKALMARIAAHKDRAAFQALFQHFGPRIKAVMMRSGSEEALAEDLVQDVMMTVWRKVHLYAPDRGSVSAWIFAIARNARINHLRKGSSRPYEDVETVELVSEEPGGEETTLLNQRARSVHSALKELPGDQRQILELAYGEDLSQSEIAEKLSLPLGTVKSRMRLAYAKLRGRLEAVQ